MAQVKARETLPMRWFTKAYEMYDYNLLFIRWLADFSGVDLMVENYQWIDADSYAGYIVTSAIQMWMIVITCTGLSAADTAILLFVANLIAYVDVFTDELDKLNEMLKEEVRVEERIKRQVRNICIQHQDIIEYESDLDERYIVISFGQIIGAVTTMSVSIFLVYMVNFIPGYALVVTSFFQLLEFCLLGTILTVKNQDIIQAIYNTNWYLLSEPERHCFALMLHKSQNFTEMTIGGFAPLNLETFVSIMNRVYSYFMMLISFIE